MKRRLLAGLMAGMLVFSSCAPAWAAEGLPGEYETEAASAEDGSEEVPDLAEDQPDGELAADEEASLPDEIPNDPEDLQETGGDAITDGLISDTVSDQDAPTDAIGEAEAAEETESEAAAEETEEMPGIIPDEEDGSPEEAEPETDEEEILEEAPEEAVQMADGDEEDIEYEREWDRNMLPGWDGTVRGSYGVHYRVDDEDIDDWYKVTNVEIVSDKPSEPNRKVIVDFHKDSNENDPDNDYWWYYRAGNYGEATLKVTYQDIKGAEQNYQFTLFVCGDAYSVYMDSNGRERNAFPGGEIGLYADAWHEYIDDNGEQQGESESLKYVWSVTQGAEYAVVTPDAGDPSKATLQFNELPADEDWINEEVVVGVRVQDAEGEDTEAYDETHFWVRSGYTEVWPIDLDMGLDVGGVLEDYEFEVRRYEFGRDGYETIDPEAVRYEWHYDENALAVTETVGGKTHIIPDGESGEGNVFTITRKGDWDTSFSVKASWKEGDDDQEAWGNYRFRNRNCDIWFDEHDCDIYTDAEEMPAILLNVNNLGDNWQERLDLDLIAGHWDNDDWQGDPLTIDDDYTLKPEGDHIAVSLTKEYLDSVKDNDDVRIWAAVYLKNAEHTEDNRLRDTDAWFHIEQARSEYDFDWEEITMLPGWEHFIYRWQNADIYSSRVKGGEWHGDVEVLSVKSEDPAIADVKYNEWDNDEFPDGKDHNWTVRANSFGSTTITLTYKDWDGSEANYDFKVSVSDEQYELHSWIEGDSDISLPGGIINLKADIRHSIYDPKTGEHWDESRDEIAEKVRFAWNIKDDEDSLRWIDHLEYPAGEDGDQAKVYLKDLPDGYNGIWRDLFVEVRAVSVDDPDDVKGYDCQRIVISDSYYEVSVPGFDDDIWQGQEMTVTPELRRYPSRNDGNASGYDVITKDVYFRWEYDDEAVEIKDSAGNIVGNYDKIDTGETDEDGQPIYDYRYRGSELSGVAGTAYTIRKLKNYDTGVRLIIDYINDTGDEDECGWGRNFWEHGTDFWIETPGGNNVFTDGDRTVELNLDNYESAPDDLYELRYEVSAWYPKDDSFNDWEEKPLPEQYFTVSGSGLNRKLTLKGKALAELREEEFADHLKVHALIILGDGADAEIISDQEQDYWVRDPWFDHHDGVNFGDDNMFIDESRTLNGFYDGCWIGLHNSAYPDGDRYPFVITYVKAENSEEDLYDNRPVLNVEKNVEDKDHPQWNITAFRSGEAIVTLSLDILDPEKMSEENLQEKIGETTVSYRVWVGDFRAFFNFKTGTGSFDVLAGNALQIFPGLRAERQNPEYGHMEEVDASRYRISLQAYTEEIHDDEFDWDEESDPTPGCRLIQKDDGSWSLETDKNAPEQRIRIEARAYDHENENPEHEWEITYSELRVEVTNNLTTLEVSGWNENLMVGESSTITPSVKIFNTNGQDGVPYESDDLFYEFEWYEQNDPEDPDDQSEFLITDAEGRVLTYHAADPEDNLVTGTPPFKVQRLVDWDTELEVVAYDLDRRGRRFEVARKKLYVNRDSYPVYYEGKPGRGDEGYTWFYSNEEDIRLTPNLSSLEELREREPDSVKVELSYGRRDYTSEEIILNPLKNYEYNAEKDCWEEAEGYFSFTPDEWSDLTGLDLSGTTQKRRDEIMAILREQDGGFHARVRVTYGDRVLADSLIWVEICPAQKRLEDDDQRIIIGKEFIYADGKATLYIEDAAHCGGNAFDDRPGKYYEVQFADSDDAIQSSDRDILNPVKDDDGTWRIEALKQGSATITYRYSYVEKDDTPVTDETHSTVLHVLPYSYYLTFEDSNGDERFGTSLLAGTEDAVNPVVWLRTWNEEKAEAGEEDPYDWERVYPSDYEVEYRFYNERLIHVDDNGTIKANNLSGNTNINVAVWINGENEDPWFIANDFNVNVSTREGRLNLSEEVICAEPGDIITIEGITEDKILPNFTIRSLINPEGTPANAAAAWFDGIFEEDRTGGLTLSDPTEEHDWAFQTLKISDNILDQAEAIGALSESGVFNTGVWINVVNDDNHGDTVFAGDGLRIVVHDHKREGTLEEITVEGTGITYWHCPHCGKYFSDKGGTTETAIEGIEDVQEVWDLINKLQMTGMKEKEAVEAAEEAYNNLTEPQQTLLGSAAKSALDGARESLDRDLADIKNAEDLIDVLSGAENSREAVDAASRAVYALGYLAGFIDPKKKEVLSAAEAALEKASEVDEAIRAVSEQSLETREGVELAREKADDAAELLKQQADSGNPYLAEDAQQKLSDATAAVITAENNVAAADAAKKLVDDLPAAIGANDVQAATNAFNAISALTPEQQRYIGGAEAVAALKQKAQAAKTQAEAAKNNKDKADAVIRMINALKPNAGVADKAAVEAARKAYNALTAAQKALVGSALSRLTAAEQSVAAAEKAAAEAAAEPKVTIPKMVKSLKAKASGKKVTVTWKKDKKTIKKQKIQGYEIRVTSAADPKSDAIITKKLGKGKTKFTFKPGKGTWHVWIRYYRADGVSNWKHKKVKVKK